MITLSKRVTDLTGLKFGRLLVKEFSSTGKDRLALWICICDCGNIKLAKGIRLVSGSTASCGCLRSELGKARATHRMTDTKAYSVWSGMHSRCNNPSATGYKNYGGRGIKICKEWSDFTVFLSEMGSPPDGKTLDRIDNDIGYSKENCKWSTRFEQLANRRKTIHITAFGQSKTLSEWVRSTGIGYKLAYDRIFYSKWDHERALTQ